MGRRASLKAFARVRAVGRPSIFFRCGGPSSLRLTNLQSTKLACQIIQPDHQRNGAYYGPVIHGPFLVSCGRSTPLFELVYAPLNHVASAVYRDIEMLGVGPNGSTGAARLSYRSRIVYRNPGRRSGCRQHNSCSSFCDDVSQTLARDGLRLPCRLSTHPSPYPPGNP